MSAVMNKTTNYDVIPYDPADLSTWRALRRNGIGGSDAAKVAGLHPSGQPLQTYLEKRGELPDADLDSEAAYFGLALEDFIAQEYAQRSGRKVRRVNRMLKSKQHPYMLANIDRDIVGERRGLECKNIGAHMLNNERWGTWGEDGSDQVPEHYYLQCAHYMAVLNYDVFDLAVLIGGQQFRIYTIERDDELIRHLIEIEGEFWQRVLTGQRPEWNYASASTGNLLKRLYPGSNGGSVLLSPAAQEASVIERDAAEKIKHYEMLRKESRNLILAEMGQAAIGLLDDGAGYTRAERNRKGYVVEPTTYVDFRFSAKAGAKANAA
jgi:putative phage-type endonuclease